MTKISVLRPRKMPWQKLIKTAWIVLAAAFGTSPAAAADPDKNRPIPFDGLHANMPANEAAAYLKSKGVRVSEATKDGIALVVIESKERIAGMRGEMSLGFSRRGLQTIQYYFEDANLPDYETVVKRLIGHFGEPVGEFTPRFYRGLIGNSASAHAFFGGPPRSVSLFYRVFCAPYPRRRTNEKIISIHFDLRPIVFPPKRMMVTGDADGWCTAG